MELWKFHEPQPALKRFSFLLLCTCCTCAAIRHLGSSWFVSPSHECSVYQLTGKSCFLCTVKVARVCIICSMKYSIFSILSDVNCFSTAVDAVTDTSAAGVIVITSLSVRCKDIAVFSLLE